MSADLLRRAAQKLREHAQAVADADTFAEGVPWVVEDDDEDTDAPYVVANLSEYSTVYIGQGFLSRAHADFVALLHPPVALALADLLERYADVAPFVGWDGVNGERLIAVARAVLREEAS